MFPQKKNHINILIVFLMASIYFFSYFQRVSVPGTIFNELQSDFNATASQISMLGAIVFYVYASMHLVTGSMADRFGAGRSMLFGGTIMAVGSLLFPLSYSMSMLFFSRSLLALGASLVYVSLVKEIDELFDQKYFAFVLSLAAVWGYSGGLFGTFPLERLVNFVGWRKSFIAMGAVCCLIVAITGFVLYKFKKLVAGNSRFSLNSFKIVITNRMAFPAVFTGSVCLSLYFLLQAAIGKKLLEDCFSFSSARAADFTFAMMIMNMAGIAASGFLSQLLGNKRKPMLVFASLLSLFWTLFILLILKGMVSHQWLLLCYLLSALSSAFAPIFACAIKETNPQECAGTAIGLSNGISYLFVAIVINAAGIILDLFRNEAVMKNNAVIYPQKAYAFIFAAGSVLAAISLMTSFLIRESKGCCIYPNQ